MDTDLFEQWFEQNDKEYCEFDRIPEAERLRPARKLCGLLKVASLMKDPADFSFHAEHDEIFLAAPDDLRPDVTEADVVSLLRCSVRWDSNGWMAMFT
jgi:hypothetical protein